MVENTLGVFVSRTRLTENPAQQESDEYMDSAEGEM